MVMSVVDKVKKLIKRDTKKKVEKETEATDESVAKTPVSPLVESEKILTESMQELKRRLEQEKEARKKVEEKYDELRVEYQKVIEEVKKKDEELKKTQEKVKEIEEESKKLVKIVHKRYKKGQYIPAILWTERGNPLPYKFVVEIAWVNGGYRALLVDSITADPSTGEWFPPLHMPAPNFCFRDDPGFNPDDPDHSVLFDVNRHDWEEDLKVTQNDPHAKPVALTFGIDIKGNPIHKLQYGAPIHINTLRAENRNLKRQVMMYYHRWKETEEKWRDAEYRYQMEKDLREHLEREVKMLKAQLYELRDALLLMGDEIEVARDAWESEKRRRIAATKRALKAEEMFDAYFGRPMISELPGAEFFEHKSKEKQAEIIALLAPIARIEAKQYGIETKGKSDEEMVYEWLKAKYERENKTLTDVLRETGLDTKVADILLSVTP